ncbi:MAG: membrane dipeptidase [Erysipelotrichia bacterium]|nr:membrane dipeptidase [Erysipelotrichia bacterium]NCC55289.1 membrane dipeptidase [Erysipelotrichia bacterium]
MKVVDMHCDTLAVLLDKKLNKQEYSLKENDLQVDLQKMKEGDYLLQNFACFTCLKEVDDPVVRVNQLIDLYHEQIELHKDRIAPVLRYRDIAENEKRGLLSSLLTIEEGGVVANDLSLLRNYYRLGVRMITLTWNYANGIGYPNFESKKTMAFSDLKKINTNDGLTAFGIEYIKEMQRLGIIIDVSHLSDAGFYDVLKYSEGPFVASHSNARTICDVARNMSDDMILALAQRKGVMGINFCGDFLKQSNVGNEVSMIEDMVKHIIYIKSLAGIDCIGLGSDFDGITSTLEIKNASMMQHLAKALKAHHFSEEEIEKIFYKNVLRVYQAILK